MFRTLCIIAALASVSAFSPVGRTTRMTRAFTSTEEPMVEAAATFAMEDEVPPAPPASVAPRRLNAKWLPVGGVLAPAALDGTLAGVRKNLQFSFLYPAFTPWPVPNRDRNSYSVYSFPYPSTGCWF